MAKHYSNRSWSHVLPRLQEDKFLLLYHPNLYNVAPHNHLFLELTYILSGTVEHTINGQTSILQAGDYFLVDYGCMHAYRTIDDRPFANLDCIFLPELLDPALTGTESLHDLFEHYLLHFNLQALTENPANMIFHDRDNRIRGILEHMQTENEMRAPGYSEMIRCHLIEILLLTVRRLDHASIASGGQNIASYLTSYISKYYMQPISLSDLAEHLNYSLPYVSKCFKEEMGVTFVNYLQNYRIKQASRLLITTQKTLPEIAQTVGYRDVKFFTELFKNSTGLTPGAFRRMHRKHQEQIY